MNLDTMLSDFMKNFKNLNPDEGGDFHEEEEIKEEIFLEKEFLQRSSYQPFLASNSSINKTNFSSPNITEFVEDSSDSDENESSDEEVKRIMSQITLPHLFIENKPKKLEEKCKIEEKDNLFLQRTPKITKKENKFSFEKAEVFDDEPCGIYEDGIPPSEDNFTRKTKKNQIYQVSCSSSFDGEKDITTCCVAADINGQLKPNCIVFGQNNEIPKIHWMSFPGFHLSPFEEPPVDIDNYLAKSRKKILAKPKENKDEAISFNYCSICKMSYDSVSEHRESEEHKRNVELYNWSTLDDYIDKINEKNFN